MTTTEEGGRSDICSIHNVMLVEVSRAGNHWICPECQADSRRSETLNGVGIIGLQVAGEAADTAIDLAILEGIGEAIGAIVDGIFSGLGD